ncbi:hypothetical protein QE152_g39289 [Popillia japonica]|uniref:acid phosphatase n=1 Tax=Popillia japonica TaxID=7064 RepID=A0AAW1HU06_POPJA
MPHRHLWNVELSNLVLLHILFRHGNRTPTNYYTFKGDTNLGLYQPYGPGQLTNEGKRRAYGLGQYIRGKYIDFIGNNYIPGVLDPLCTESDRAQVSLQLFLAGLFPPIDALIWNKDLLWQPIPYKYNSAANDKILACLHNHEFLDEHIKYQKESGIFEKHKAFFEFVSQKVGFKVNGLVDIWRLYIRLITETEYGSKLPDWTAEIFPKPLEDFAIENYLTQMMTPKMRSMAIDTNAKLAAKSRVKVHIYSAHELNVAHLLLGLKSFIPPHLPNYCSCLIFEIRERKGDIYVQVLYKRNFCGKTEQLPLWGNNPCQFDMFVKIFYEKNVVPYFIDNLSPEISPNIFLSTRQDLF